MLSTASRGKLTAFGCFVIKLLQKARKKTACLRVRKLRIMRDAQPSWIPGTGCVGGNRPSRGNGSASFCRDCKSGYADV